jgi:hypothetical protein
MAWSFERLGSTLKLRIDLPVDDWEALLDEVHQEMRGDVSSVAIPEVLPGASSCEADLLELLSHALKGAGIVTVTY